MEQYYPNLYLVGMLGAIIYCFARAVVDVRARRFVWCALGVASGAILLLTPVKTHAVKFDLPVSPAN